MRGLIQRVSEAAVVVEGEVVGQIGPGLLVLLGVAKGDTEAQADRLLDKILNYRVFPDADGKMNLSLTDTAGGLLVVSQFTLAADTQKGLRPSFSSAEVLVRAEALYEYLVAQACTKHGQVAKGRFGAHMQVRLINDGPVTFLLEV